MTESRPVDTEFLAANWKDQDCIHALVIGVGDYQAHEIQTGLTSLRSPPLSAYELGRFILDAPLGSHARPLGSLELLISPFEDDKVMRGWNHEIQRADLGPIQAAFNRWYARCHEREGNLALFYFCGHGYQKDDFVILPSDFGANPNNKWQSAINMTKTLQGMKQCRAKQQVYWFDACRNLNRDLLQERDFGGVSLKAGRYDGARVHEIHELYATAEGFKAFGHAGRLSRFSQALLESLRIEHPTHIEGIVTANSVAISVYEHFKKENLYRESQPTVRISGGPGQSIVLRGNEGSRHLLNIDLFNHTDLLAYKQNRQSPKRMKAKFGFISSRGIPQSIGNAYTAQEKLLENIHQTLHTNRLLTLSGMAGIGKTRAAVEYARRYHKHYPGGIFWLDASNTDQFRLELYASLLAIQPQSPSREEVSSPESLRQFLRKELAKRETEHGDILWIVDNIPEPQPGENPHLLAEYCPNIESVHILLTSRFNFKGGERNLVIKKLGILDTKSASKILTFGLPKDFLGVEDKVRICAWVGHLPLALEILNRGLLEGAFSKKELIDSISVAPALPGLDMVIEALSESIPSGSLQGVSQAFLLSYNALDTDSQDLACRLSLLAPRPIPIQIIEALQENKLTTRKARVKITSRNFLSGANSENFGTIHNLMRDFLRTQVNDPDKKHRDYFETLQKMLNLKESLSAKNWNAQIPLIEHLSYLTEEVNVHTWQSTYALLTIGLFWQNVGELKRGLATLRSCLQIAESSVGGNDINILLPLVGLASAELRLGNVSEALQHNKNAHVLSKRHLGNLHPLTLTVAGNLATNYGDTGDFDRSIELNHEVHRNRKNLFGAKHPDTINSLNNLAIAYKNAGNYTKQLQLIKQAHSLSAEVFGEEHPHTLTTLDNLSDAYFNVGDYDSAFNFGHRGYLLNKKTLGEKHPSTLISLANLANITNTKETYSKPSLSLRRSSHSWRKYMEVSILTPLQSATIWQ